MDAIEAFEKLNNLTEQAMTRRDAMNRVMDLAPQFIRHFDKIYNDTDPKLISHWASEMQAWLNAVLAIKLSSTNRPLSLQQKIEWFFSCGSDSETLFPDNPTEAEVYDDFIDLLAISNNVEASLIELDLM